MESKLDATEARSPLSGTARRNFPAISEKNIKVFLSSPENQGVTRTEGATVRTANLHISTGKSLLEFPRRGAFL